MGSAGAGGLRAGGPRVWGVDGREGAACRRGGNCGRADGGGLIPPPIPDARGRAPTSRRGRRCRATAASQRSHQGCPCAQPCVWGEARKVGWVGVGSGRWGEEDAEAGMWMPRQPAQPRPAPPQPSPAQPSPAQPHLEDERAIGGHAAAPALGVGIAAERPQRRAVRRQGEHGGGGDRGLGGLARGSGACQSQQHEYCEPHGGWSRREAWNGTSPRLREPQCGAIAIVYYVPTG